MKNKISYPIFIGEFIRSDDSNNTYTVKKEDWIGKLNFTSYNILSMCNGENSIDHIILEVYNSYNGVSLKDVTRDIITFVFNAYLRGLIIFHVNNYFAKMFEYKNSNYEFRVCDVNTTYNYIKMLERKKSCLLAQSELINYKKKDISSLIISGEEYFFVIQNEKEILYLIGINPNIIFNHGKKEIISTNIVYIHARTINIDSELLVNFILYCHDFIYGINDIEVESQNLYTYVYSKCKEDKVNWTRLGFLEVLKYYPETNDIYDNLLEFKLKFSKNNKGIKSYENNTN